MEIVQFVATVILLTASGALAPGPLFFATLSHGSKGGAKSGLVFSFAHTLVEFALVILLALGLLTLAGESIVRLIIGAVGGIVLMVFGSFQIYNSLSSRVVESQPSAVAFRNLFVVGLAFTGLNPFFVIWWLTAGAQLIIISLEFGHIAGVVFMYLCHVWMDYVWLIATAHFAKIGMSVTGFRWYRLVIVVFGAVLVYFGVTFFLSSASLIVV